MTLGGGSVRGTGEWCQAEKYIIAGFDQDGNLTSGTLPVDQTSNATLVWDAENRLVAIAKADNTVIYYSYDAQSRRISKQIDTAPVTS